MNTLFDSFSRRFFLNGIAAGVGSFLVGKAEIEASKNRKKKSRKNSHNSGKKKNNDSDSKADEISVDVMGGTGVADGAYPFMVAIASGPDPYANQFCGGFLLSDRHVGTAGHCVHGQNPADLWLHIGFTDLTQFGGVSVRASGIAIDPKYSWKKDTRDFAVITLSEPVDTTLYPPAVLATNADFLSAGQSGIVLGWGNLTNTGAVYPTRLQEAVVPIYSDKTGKKDYTVKFRGKKRKKGGHKVKKMSWFKGGVMIAADKPGTGSCDADSGGPLGGWINGRFNVRGIVSWGGNRCASKQVGVYADVIAGSDFFSGALTS